LANPFFIPSIMSFDSEQFNEAVQQAGQRLIASVKSNGKSLGIDHRGTSPSRGPSLDKIRDKYGKDSSGIINRVTIGNINRSLIYASVGAGKGRGGRKGSRWVNANGQTKFTNPASLGKMGTGGRSAKPFIDAALDGSDGVELLADTVAIHAGDAIIESIYKK
jgi:hypothetical protein